MLLNKTVEICITARNVNYYKDKGYNIPMRVSEKSGKLVIDSNIPVEIKIEDLPNSSHKKIQYKCDSCGKIFTTDYHSWINSKRKELGDLCKCCAVKIKLPQAMLDKYGEANSANVPSIIRKKKQTNLAKYGNEWAIASDSVRENIENSILSNFGVSNPMMSPKVKEKAKRTNNSKYGGNSSQCDKNVKRKSVETCLLKYGVENPFQLKEIQEKARETLYKNGTVPSSKAEKELCEKLKEVFGKENCFPSYPVGNFSLDCLVILGDNKIDFEYDGCYWHKERKQKDAARNAILMNEGYRIIRIKGNNQDILPSKEKIKETTDYLINNNRHLIFIDMNV